MISCQHFPHSHYTRQLVYQKMDPSEIFQEDTRTKILLRLPSPLPEALIEPELWFRLGVKVLPSIIHRLPAPTIYLQRGPTCGLFAMKMIAPWLNVYDLFDEAKSSNKTIAGEMFCAHEWAELAQKFGVGCTVMSITDIAHTLLRHPEKVAVVPYDSDLSGISFRRGRNAHWCVVWSVWQVDDELLALTTNSSSTKPSIERWSELEMSNRQLESAMVRINDEMVQYIDAKCLNGFGVVVL